MSRVSAWLFEARWFAIFGKALAADASYPHQVAAFTSQLLLIQAFLQRLQSMNLHCYSHTIRPKILVCRRVAQLGLVMCWSVSGGFFRLLISWFHAYLGGSLRDWCFAQSESWFSLDSLPLAKQKAPVLLDFQLSFWVISRVSQVSSIVTEPFKIQSRIRFLSQLGSVARGVITWWRLVVEHWGNYARL
jgi:hypothetical protein